MTRPSLFVTRRLPRHVEAALADRFAVSMNTEEGQLGPEEMDDLVAFFEGREPRDRVA